MILLLMGVSGVGKTTLGRLLAVSLGYSFYDADDFHAPANIAKMRRGLPLDDADRQPWLATLQTLLKQLIQKEENAILACSALKASYREVLLCGPQVRLIHLTGHPQLIRSRLQQRAGHFAPASLLESQLAALEEPHNALVFEVDASPAELVERIKQALAQKPAGSRQ